MLLMIEKNRKIAFGLNSKKITTKNQKTMCFAKNLDSGKGGGGDERFTRFTLSIFAMEVSMGILINEQETKK